ncbi:MAG TPA: MarR family transcriptional regulator [Gaiellaceae bacterium]|nr:MarR family transcriptional regulator [Gaiellaceae bacterium]
MSRDRVASATAARGGALTRRNIGFLLAKASQRWNELLARRFAEEGFPEVRPAFGSLLVPLYEEDGLRQGELARRARLSKQTLTTMSRALEGAGLVERRRDPADARATLVYLTERAQAFRPVAERVLAELDEQAVIALPIARDELTAALERLASLENDSEQTTP